MSDPVSVVIDFPSWRQVLSLNPLNSKFTVNPGKFDLSFRVA